LLQAYKRPKKDIDDNHHLAGDSDKASLQYGCNINVSGNSDISMRVDQKNWPRIAVNGRWASQDERIGEVQCCLTAPFLHVCTRD
jgi:hypothetical protein